MDIQSLPLPPGSTGWPLVGEALSLKANPFGFVGERVARHGPVVRSKLLNTDLAILAGEQAAVAFLDEANIRRAGGLPPHAANLFGAGVVNSIDGDAHKRRKRHLMRALDLQALAHYHTELRTRIRSRIGAWVESREVKLQDVCIPLGLELTLSSFAGLSPTDAELQEYAQGYESFGRALIGLPLAIPGTPLAHAQAFNARMHALFGSIAEQRRREPTGDGISRLVASEVDGERLATIDIARELQHLVFAASGLWGWFCYGALALANDPALYARMREVAAALPRDATPRELMEAPELDAFVREVKRLGLIIPFTALGVAKRDFAVAGFRVPKDWLVLWSTYASHRTPGVAPYTSPDLFDPSRYARGEGSAPNQFAPQGPGEALTSHRCGGVEYSTLVLLHFFTELLRAPMLRFPEQDMTMDMSQLPASWHGRLRATFG